VRSVSQILGIGLVVAVTIAAGAFVSGSRPQQWAGDTSSASAELLALSLEDSSGVPQSFARWRGKVLVVNFWATWCPPCTDEIPEFSRMSEQWAPKGVQFVGIGVDQADKIREFARRSTVSYPLLIGPPNAMQMAVALGDRAEGLPFTVVIDAKGRVKTTRLGRLDEKELAVILSSAL
jgi:thiol-disulfide isomerase/thioredoxin